MYGRFILHENKKLCSKNIMQKNKKWSFILFIGFELVCLWQMQVIFPLQ